MIKLVEALNNVMEDVRLKNATIRYNKVRSWALDNRAEWATERHPLPRNADSFTVKNVIQDLCRDLGFADYHAWERSSW